MMDTKYSILDASNDFAALSNKIGMFKKGLCKEEDLAFESDDFRLVTVTELTRVFLPDFVKRNDGKILNTSSTASLIPGPLQAVYYATKAYITSFSNAIAEELHDTNVTVTALLPGATKTEFGKISGMDKTIMFQKTASARNVAQDGYDAMIEGELNIISGVTFSQKIMFFVIPFLPKRMILKQVRKMQEVDN